MNIISRQTAHNDRDPFAESDRKHPIGRHAGKGDGDRSDPKTFRENFPETMGPAGGRVVAFRKVYEAKAVKPLSHGPRIVFKNRRRKG